MINPTLLLTWLFAASSVLLLTGCGDNPTTGTTVVEGQVVERSGRQPVGGAMVQLWLAGKAGGYGEAGDPQPCDAQGRFSFRFDAERKGGYLIKAYAPPGYFTDWAEAAYLTAGRKNTGLVVPMLAPAWVRLQFVDELPKSRVSIFTTGYRTNGEQWNYPRDTALIRPAIAGLTKHITWFITDDRGIQTRIITDVQLAPLDTLTVRIPF
jgi:protocatechuate 3,4-dioxygenase beta subunit